MDLRSALRALVEAAPPDATVPVRWIGELLATEPVSASASPSDAQSVDLSVDLTVEQVAARFGKGASTIRTWLARGELPGAYRLHGHEWRVPSSAVLTLQRTQASQHTQRPTSPPKSRHAVDLGEWRKHTKAAQP